MYKPTIPNEVADVIEDLICEYNYNSRDIVCLALGMDDGASNDTQTLGEITFDTLLSALVNGYEREKTEEQKLHDKLKAVYNTYNSGTHGLLAEGYAFAAGMKYALSEVGIYIDGINK